MRVVLTIFFLLAFCVAKAQFKPGSFSLGISPDLSFDTFGESYYSGVNIIFGANVFVSSKNEIGLALKSAAIISDISTVQSERYTYYIYYNHYFPLNQKAGFYNQTELNYFYQPLKRFNETSINEELNIKNNMVFYVFVFKGLVLNTKFNLVNYKTYYSYNKSSFSEGTTNAKSFNFILNPSYNLDLQIGLNYYFNTTRK